MHPKERKHIIAVIQKTKLSRFAALASQLPSPAHPLKTAPLRESSFIRSSYDVSIV